MKADLLAAALRLSPSERLELIEALWDTLAEQDLPVTPEEQALLDARLADLDANPNDQRSEEHTSELQSLAYLVCRLLLEKKKYKMQRTWLRSTDRTHLLGNASQQVRELRYKRTC